MNQQQASQIIGTSKGANHQISKISQIQFSYSQKARQIRENNSVLGNGSIGNNISLKESDSSLIVNLQGIRDNPFAYINKDTTRDMLFRMAYLLEETNKELIYKFEVNKNYLLNQPEISAKYNISKADVQQRKTIIMQLKQKNLQNSAQVKLLELYQKQKQQLSQKLQLKHRAIEELSLKRKQKQEKRNQFNLMVKKSNERIIEFKKQKQRLTDEARRKKNNEKSADSGIVDRLLTEYYETIKEVLDEGSVDRINANTKAALCEVEKRKNAGFLNILKDNMQGLESNPQ